MKRVTTLLLVLFLFGSPPSVSSKTVLDILVVVPLTYERPDGVYVEIDDTSLGYAQQAAEWLDERVEQYSDNAATTNVRVEYPEFVGPDTYNNVDGWYVDGKIIGTWYSDYDVILVITDPDAVTTWYKGLTAYPTREVWVLAYEEAPNVALHELGHVLEIMLNEQGYYLSACFDVPASLVHCADYYGYGTNGTYHSEAWLDDFYSEWLTPDLWDVLAVY